MSSVEQGGATVFPYHRVVIQPKKGTAAFWFNLFKDGEGDWSTYHAACPVLVGSKWGELLSSRGSFNLTLMLTFLLLQCQIAGII